MKKLETKEQRGKRIKRNQLTVGIVLVGLMILSTVGYAFIDRTNTSNTNSEKIEYKGIKFYKETNYWNFNLNNYDFTTQYNPLEVQNLNPLILLSFQDYSGKPLYFLSEPGEPISEFARNLNERFVLRMQRACLPNSNCTENLPVKNCSTDNIIIIKEPLKNEKENIYQEEKCVFIIAKYANQTKFSDAVLFRMLGL